jgi:hypothetical protein
MAHQLPVLHQRDLYKLGMLRVVAAASYFRDFDHVLLP